LAFRYKVGSAGIGQKQCWWGKHG